jgi:competence protein ComEA
MTKLLLALTLWFTAPGMALAVVNINTATKEDLMTLKGVGDGRAQEIIDYRKKNGNFKSVDDLGKVPGIGPGLMKQIRSDIAVTGTTSTDKPQKNQPKSKSATAKTTLTPKVDAIKSNAAKNKLPEKLKASDQKPDKKQSAH